MWVWMSAAACRIEGENCMRSENLTLDCSTTNASTKRDQQTATHMHHIESIASRPNCLSFYGPPEVTYECVYRYDHFTAARHSLTELPIHQAQRKLRNRATSRSNVWTSAEENGEEEEQASVLAARDAVLCEGVHVLPVDIDGLGVLRWGNWYS